MIVLVTALKTKSIFSVSVAHVKCTYISLFSFRLRSRYLCLTKELAGSNVIGPIKREVRKKH